MVLGIEDISVSLFTCEAGVVVSACEKWRVATARFRDSCYQLINDYVIGHKTGKPMYAACDQIEDFSKSEGF
jgi:hypothetical protein